VNPIIAIVGRPNVGKSTLFNRLIGERRALVMDTPGVTRDRNYGNANWYGRDLSIVDTGGFDPVSQEGMLPQMREQAQVAIDEADVVLFLLDGREGLVAADHEVFGILRQATCPVLVVANKIDTKKQKDDVFEFHALGVDQIFPTSSEHGIGVSDLMEEVVACLPEFEAVEIDESRIRVAIVGRPNVGKSTLVNQLLGSNRVLASETPGTTRDAIDTDFDVDERRYTLIDTAGVRRRRSISWALEKFSVIKAFQSIEKAHVAVVMCDAAEGITDQDARIINIAQEHGRAVVIAINKWDAVDKDSGTSGTFVKDFHHQMPLLSHLPVIFVSALTGQRTLKLLELVDVVHANWNTRVSTAPLNRWFSAVTRRLPPPLYKHRAVRLYYFTQARAAPPTFVVQTNMDPEAVTTAYRRFLMNQLRESFGFEGCPIRLKIRKRGKRDEKGS
jgi:GTP-binding protein